MKNVVELNGWVVIWDLDGCRFLTVYDTEREAREFGENPKRQGVALFIGSAGDLIARLAVSEDAAEATPDGDGRVAALANLSRWITQAAGREGDDGNRQLLTDAGLELLHAAWAVKAFRDTIEEVRKVAVLIQETSSPNSIIATDVRARLQSIERDLMNFVQVDVD